MAERRKGRRKRDDDIKAEDDKPSKMEYAVFKYLKNKLPEKKTALLSHKVSYFIASKSIDCLLDSPWATGKEKGPELLFTNRESVVRFMDTMLRHKFFHRARKIVVQKEKKKPKKGKEDEKSTVEEVKENKELTEIKDVAKKVKKGKEEKSDKEIVKKEVEEVEKKKEKKKFKLDMHLEQIFIDGSEAYVWIYDPIPVRAWIIGTLMVVGAVLVCLFPLWPKIVRHYVYYLSVAAAGFLVFIIGLAVIRLVVFVLVWLVTFGKHHLWLLPNLTEDVGFFESFWPFYKYEFKGDQKEEANKENGEGDNQGEPEEELQEEALKKEPNEDEGTESESEGSREGNGDNGFEILEAEEATEEEQQQPTQQNIVA